MIENDDRSLCSRPNEPARGRTLIVVSVLLLVMATIGYAIYLRVAPKTPARPPPVPPRIIYEIDENGVPTARYDPDLFREFLEQCGLPPLAQPLPPAEKEQFESFHAALIVLGRERRAEDYGLAGMFFLYWSRSRMAETLLLKAHELAPREHRWCHYLGYNAASSGDLEGAERYYKLAIDRDPNFSASYQQLARLYAYELNKPEVAEAMLLRSIEVEPEFLKAKKLKAPQAYAHGELAGLALRRNDIASAEQYALEALRRDPNDRRAHSLLGQIYARLGQSEKERFHAAAGAQGTLFDEPVPDPLIVELRERTNALALLTQRATLEYEQKQYAQLAKTSREMARRDPLPDRLMQLADALRLNREYDEARRIALGLLDQDPDHARYHLTLGKIEFSSGDIEQALPSFDAALALDADLVEALQWKAKALASKGTALIDRGEIAAGKSALEEALLVARDAIRHGPAETPSYPILGLIQYRIGRSELAAAASKETRARVLSRYREARDAFVTAANRNPANAEYVKQARDMMGELARLEAEIAKD